jgi:hypothetical protein
MEPRWEKIASPGPPGDLVGILRGAIQEVQDLLVRRTADLTNLVQVLSVARDRQRELEQEMRRGPG